MLFSRMATFESVISSSDVIFLFANENRSRFVGVDDRRNNLILIYTLKDSDVYDDVQILSHIVVKKISS